MITDIIRQRHAAYKTSEHVIADVVKRATGQETTAQEKLVRGYDNEVYIVQTRSGGDFVVRIRHHGGAGFAEEAWAIEQCRGVGVPAPEVYLIEAVTIDDQPREVMVQRRVPGRALSEIAPNLQRGELEHIWQQAGAALGAIHSIAVGGFYKLRPNGRWDFPDWDSMAQTGDRAAERPLLLQAGFADQDVDLMLSILKVEEQDFTIRQPVLCHGDFLPGHLFVDDQLRLTGVIDFGEFQGGTPLVDFANLSMDCPEVDLGWLQRGYPSQALFDESFARRLLLVKVGMQMGYLAHYIQQGNSEEAAPIATGLRASLREWEAYK
jgi:aminoglycoside phosphotransferase (APT) family kinase protein